MARTLADRVKDLEAAIIRAGLGGGSGQTIIVNGQPTTATPTGVAIDGSMIGAERTINFLTGDPVINIAGTDNPGNGSLDLLITSSSSAAAAAGVLDLGSGAATGAGYALTSTTGAAIDLDQDLVVPCDVGQLVLFVFNGLIDGGTGTVLFDVLSTNSGEYAGLGFPGPGIASWQCPPTVTTPRSGVFSYVTQSTDILAGNPSTATFRLMYRLTSAGGAPVLLKNDTDGHFNLLAYPIAPVSMVGGQNTGGPPINPPPPPTPVTTGAVTTTSVTAQTTLSSVSSKPTAGDVIYEAVWLGIAEDTTSVTMSLTDSFHDSGGSSWTQRAQLSVPGAGGGGTPTITVVRSATGSNTATSTITPSLGGVPAVGNLVVVMVDTASTTTPPTNWTLDEQSNTFGNQAMLSHVVDGTTTGDSTGNYTLNLGSGGINAVWAVYEVHASTSVTWALDKHGNTHSYPTSNTSLQLSPGTTTVANEIVFYLGGCNNTSVTNVIFTPPAGGALTNDFSHAVNSPKVLSSAHKILTSTTLLSATTMSWTTSDNSSAFLMCGYSATGTGSASSASIWLYSRLVGTGAATGSVVCSRNAGTLAQAFTTCPFEISGVNEAVLQSGTANPANVSAITQTLAKPTSDQFVIALAYNQTAAGSSTTISTPTQGGATWTTLASSTDSRGGGYALAYVNPFAATSFTWTGLVADTFQNAAAFIVVGASAAPTAPPGTESWNFSNSTSSITGDQTWMVRTV